ncbi:MAG: hypothetical protein RJQ00_01345 [Vicingaceae bacterium]
MSQEKNSGWKATKLASNSTFVIKEYNNEVFLVNERGEVIEVSPKGSLAFLALGSIGHQAWQKAKSIAKKNV